MRTSGIGGAAKPALERLASLRCRGGAVPWALGPRHRGADKRPGNLKERAAIGGMRAVGGAPDMGCRRSLFTPRFTSRLGAERSAGGQSAAGSTAPLPVPVLVRKNRERVAAGKGTRWRYAFCHQSRNVCALDASTSAHTLPPNPAPNAEAARRRVAGAPHERHGLRHLVAQEPFGELLRPCNGAAECVEVATRRARRRRPARARVLSSTNWLKRSSNTWSTPSRSRIRRERRLSRDETAAASEARRAARVASLPQLEHSRGRFATRGCSRRAPGRACARPHRWRR